MANAGVPRRRELLPTTTSKSVGWRQDHSGHRTRVLTSYTQQTAKVSGISLGSQNEASYVLQVAEQYVSRDQQLELFGASRLTPYNRPKMMVSRKPQFYEFWTGSLATYSGKMDRVSKSYRSCVHKPRRLLSITESAWIKSVQQGTIKRTDFAQYNMHG